MSFFAKIFLGVFAVAQNCPVISSPDFGYQQMKEYFSKTQVFECVEQEVSDPLMDPWRLQSFVITKCQQEPACLQFLKNSAAEVSNIGPERFANMTGVQLWGEIYKYSGLTRKRPPQMSDLPFSDSKDPVAIFQKLKADELALRSLPANEKRKMLCAAVFLIIGPSKIKNAARAGFGAVEMAVAARTLTSEINIALKVEKLLSRHKLPEQVAKKFSIWLERVKKEGLQEVRKTPGFHDEVFKASSGEMRSVRLNSEFRLFYRTHLVNGQEIIEVENITAHDYEFLN